MEIQNRLVVDTIKLQLFKYNWLGRFIEKKAFIVPLGSRSDVTRENSTRAATGK